MLPLQTAFCVLRVFSFFKYLIVSPQDFAFGYILEGSLHSSIVFDNLHYLILMLVLLRRTYVSYDTIDYGVLRSKM